MPFSERFKAWLSATGLSQADFIREYKIPAQTVHSWAQGWREPPEWIQNLVFESLSHRPLVPESVAESVANS